MRNDRSEEVAAELERLAVMPIVGLRALWRAKFRSEPPKAFGPDLLRRSLAQKLQEDVYGGISASARKLLNQLVAQQAKNPTGKITLPRCIKAGAVLVREWKGKSHRVMVLEDGFAFEGRRYGNLSEVARDITGTRWNGPRFFGLRTEGSQDAAEPVPSGKRGRPAGRQGDAHAS